jgi:two-component system, cell cycle response regulator
MNKIKDKLLLMTGADIKASVKDSLKDFFDLDILEAETEKKAFELIYTHFFVLIMVDGTLPHIDMYKIGSMLMSHRQTYNTPLLILTDAFDQKQKQFLSDFKALKIDYMAKPFDEQLMRAKTNIFYGLFKQKKAVEQSLNELDKIYKKTAAHHDLSIQEEFSKKELAARSVIAANQIQQPLRILQGSMNQLLQDRQLTPKIKSGLSSIKTAVDRITRITKNLAASPLKSKHVRLQSDHAPDPFKGYHILYVEDSNEDFRIFSHFIRGVINCTVFQAKTLAEAAEFISEKRIDMVFINFLLPDGNGFDLLSTLNRMRSGIPVIFTLEKHSLHKGPEALAKGAFTYFAKEEISAENIYSIIHSTLKKAWVAKEAEDARNRIIMISKKDYLTKLYNRQCFEQELESEISTAKRYQTPLSVLIADFDNFKKTVNLTHGYETGDAILTTSAALIQSLVRAQDRVCRYGGEEFGIVLPNTALNGARMLAERIKEKIAGFSFETGSTALRLTVSIGIAAYDHKSGTTVHDLAKNALHALTSAMDQGGNKIKAFIH